MRRSRIIEPRKTQNPKTKKTSNYIEFPEEIVENTSSKERERDDTTSVGNDGEREGARMAMIGVERETHTHRDREDDR